MKDRTGMRVLSNSVSRPCGQSGLELAGRGRGGNGRRGPDRSGDEESPAARHVRLDGLPGSFEIATGRLHVQPHGMHLVTGRPGQTIASCLTWVGINLNAQQLLRDHPGVARTVGHVENLLGRVVRYRERSRGFRIFRACNHDMGSGFNLKKRHVTVPFRRKKPGRVRTGRRPPARPERVPIEGMVLRGKCRVKQDGEITLIGVRTRDPPPARPGPAAPGFVADCPPLCEVAATRRLCTSCHSARQTNIMACETRAGAVELSLENPGRNDGVPSAV